MSDKKEKDPYYKMSDALDELRFDAVGKTDKAVAGLKLVGKGLYNITRFTFKEALPEINSRAQKEINNTKSKK
ncbi:hypothetical protein Undi14_04580 [Undibacterium sp. 14-3-2]|uniref:hypothetical protein n=1 Tax=Undibacterium sp. 14-3-2 TaxID=2800129 RepID=UPI0019087377|nr:hypothetical protein [Undibacterium sp. 14-3-2]MBK1889298.1 hypothetical protein [Undibacterium sp. 14-3-2]